MKKNLIKLPPFKVEKTISCLSETVDWGLLKFNVPNAWEITRGENITSYILDTAGEIDHIDLRNNISGGENFSGSRSSKDAQGHGCVSPETLVHTSFCGIEKIEKLYHKIEVPEKYSKEYGGYVKDVAGLGIKTYSFNKESGDTEVSKIVLLHRTKVNGRVININFGGNIKHTLTPWHKVYTIKALAHKKLRIEGKRADELAVGDIVSAPKNGSEVGNLITDYYRGFGSEYRECSSCGRQQNFTIKNIKGRWQCKNCNKGEFTLKRHEYLITEDWAYLIGLILTDGHLYKRKGQYRIEIAAKDEIFLKEVKSKMEKLGIENVVIEKQRTCYRLRFDNKSIHTLLVNLGIISGKKSLSQELPEFVGKSPMKVICSFMAGVIDGDGCISKKTGKHRITTASIKFAEQMCALLGSIGIRASFAQYKQYGSNLIKRTENSAKIYNINFSNIKREIVDEMLIDYKKDRARRSITGSYGFGKKIRSISEGNLSTDFYDFTVEKNHTYIANGCFVSNTHCAGIIAAEKNGIGVIGVAPEAKIVPIKVLGDNGSGSSTSIESGLKFVFDHAEGDGKSIVSMSLGSEAPLGGKVHYWIKKLYERNIPIICAAGNSGTEGVNYPAKYPETIAIGAFGEDGELAYFSTTGDQLGFTAPGVNVYSTWPNNSYAKLSGTSMSTPFMAGIVCLLLSKHLKQEKETGKNDCKTVEQVREHLIRHAIDMGEAGKDKKWGYGVVDLGKMLREND